ncbi:hypothetical protein AB0D10_03695 [Kitasatospora sp. NPDC048545]|uniref:hypothetical protein n=1 Tax=Kitasatospora sp. NPDC048545 TaxID=3157208 RepID=UPI0034072790
MSVYTEEQAAAVRRMAEHAAELPTCGLTPGEEALMGRYLDAHGDPTEWDTDTAALWVTVHNDLIGGAL